MQIKKSITSGGGLVEWSLRLGATSAVADTEGGAMGAIAPQPVPQKNV